MGDSRNLMELAERLERAWRARRIAHLKPETALILAIAARAYATHPSRDDFARALCKVKGGCRDLCFDCKGHANQIKRLYSATGRRLDESPGE